MIKTNAFTLKSTAGRWFIRGTARNAAPRGRRISASDARYLSGLAHQPDTFNAACVWDFGVGVFQR